MRARNNIAKKFDFVQRQIGDEPYLMGNNSASPTPLCT